MLEKLRETLNKNKDVYIKKLTDFVKIDTHVLGHGIDGGLEDEGQKYLIDLFKEMNADNIEKEDMQESIIEKSIKEYNEGNPNHNYDKRYNVYASFKGKSNKSIMFNGHVDTMPSGDVSLWESDPHSADIRDGKIYGLGACDMKGGLMAGIMAVKLLKDANIDLPMNVIITAVADEEGGGNGSIVAAMGGKKADAVIVCEPSDREIIAAHMGFIFFRVEINGVSVHSGSKWNGVSAIDKAIKIINAINELEHNWLMKYKHPLLPSPNLNVGVISGGKAGSTVPDYCKFETCVHYLPNMMTHDQVVKEVTEAVNMCAMGDAWLRENMPKISIYQSGGGFEMDLNDNFVEVFKKSYEEVYNKESKIVGSPAGCDSRTWKNIAKCPTLQYGPGSIKQCHTVNEYLNIDEYLESILLYSNIILNFAK